MKVNPTIAKDLAIFFLEITGQRPTSAILPRIISQVKRLGEAGFSKEDIEYTIREAVKANPSIYSFGYIEACINDFLRKKREAEASVERIKAKEEIDKMLLASIQLTEESEVVQDDETSQRNRRKAERLGKNGLQSGLGKKHYFDLFER